MALANLEFERGESSLSVRHFSVDEAISSLFTIEVTARSPNHDIDFETIVGHTAGLSIASGLAFALAGARRWTGICSHFEQVQAEPTGLSTYLIRIVPALWLLTQKRDYRIFQHLSIPDIVDRVLDAWSLERAWRFDRPAYPKLEYKVQYGETDYHFVCRLLEEAGITFMFPNDPSTMGGSKLTLDHAPQGVTARGAPLRFADNPNEASEQEFVTKVELAHEIRPGAYTLRDFDLRNPHFPLFGEGEKSLPPEDQFEQYRYLPGSFLIERGKGGDTPVADDKGVARYDQRYGSDRADHALIGERNDKRNVAFTTNAHDLAPGAVITFDGHPHAELASSARLLVTRFHLEGGPTEAWTARGGAVFADVPYRPKVRTEKPVASGVQSAKVVGASGKEIDPDELGRVRVKFPWDRAASEDDTSSCWIRVSHGWAGAGFGVIVTPRIGQEVLVGFLGGDPDQPIIVGRVYNAKNPVPYKLPDHKTRSTWKSDSSLGSNGFNEILFEDLAGRELVYLQAQKNLRKLVKNDETITVVHDRQKLVKGNETETTIGTRTEVAESRRIEITTGQRTTIVREGHQKLVKGDEIERVERDWVVRIGRDQHLIIKEVKRERIEGSSHLSVSGSRNESIGGSQSLSVGGDQHELIGKNHALEAGSEIHLKAGSALVIEAPDVTIKGPGGFVRIDGGGVTIQGTVVKINSGGSAGSGSGAKPGGPERPKEAEIEEPQKPEPDDVSKTGLAQ